MPKKILIVDDEADFCYVVKKNLEAIGPYQVLVCTESTKALELVKKERPDILLLDVLMPEVSGPQIAMQMQNDAELQNIPTIFLTGIGVMSEEGKKLQDGLIRHFVEKPVKMRNLADLISTILEKQ